MSSITLDSLWKGLDNFYQDTQTVFNPSILEKKLAKATEEKGVYQDGINSLKLNRNISLLLRVLGVALFVCSCIFILKALYAFSVLVVLLHLFVVLPLGCDFVSIGCAMSNGLPKAQDGKCTVLWKGIGVIADSTGLAIGNLFRDKEKDPLPFVIAYDAGKFHFNEDKAEEILNNTWICGLIYHASKKIVDLTYQN